MGRVMYGSLPRRARRAASRLVDVASTYDTEPVEWCVAVWLVGLGLHALVYDFVAASPSYAYHAAVPRWAQAAVDLAAGLSVLVGVSSTRADGRATARGLRLRRVGATVALALFAFDTAAFALANPAAGGQVIFGVGVMMAAWCRLRLRYDRSR